MSEISPETIAAGFAALEEEDHILRATLEREEDYEPPRLSEPGEILFRILGPGDTGVYRYEIEDHGHTGSAFWIQEGEGITYWLDERLDDGMAPSWYVVEGIRGTFHRGDGWTTDDDTDWEFDRIRPATPEEIAAEALLLAPGATVANSAAEPETGVDEASGMQ